MMKIVYHTQVHPIFHVVPNRGCRWQFPDPFVFEVDGVKFATPPGFWTDFASVPRPLWLVLSPYELGVGPIPHDFGYFSGYGSKGYWDQVFQACMEKDGIPAWKRTAAYQAVDWFAGGSWNYYRKSNKDNVLRRVIPTNTMEMVGWKFRAVSRDSGGILPSMEDLWRIQVRQLTRQV
jgi:hypothetical protein